MKPTSKEIIGRMEQFKNGDRLMFNIHETFGGGRAIIELNPDYPQNGGKKFILRVSNDIESSEKAKIFLSSNKAKHLAGWVMDRLGEWTS
jgi:hypothetical protein